MMRNTTSFFSLRKSLFVGSTEESKEIDATVVSNEESKEIDATVVSNEADVYCGYELYNKNQIIRAKKTYSGGFARAYRGKIGDKDIVLKEPYLASEDDCNLFAEEVRIIQQLNHDNIVKLYGFQVGETKAIDGIVMEPMEQDLLSFIERNEEDGITDNQAQSIMYQTYSGLHYLHEQAIIHRDVKPKNILVSQEQLGLKVKLCDFGFSVKINSKGTFFENMLRGTPGYLAPEIFMFSSYSPASDNYAGGCVFQELVTDSDAFPGETTAEVLRNNQRGRRRPLSVISNSLFKQIIEESSRINPQLRPSAEENMNRLKPR